ncbi:MAG: hypothetical protein HKL96_08825 [Phycisphaerales bacterium]|nr:hypothetical protein [Phycisphaerales bacterium]
MLESPIVQPLRDTPLVTSISQLREIFGAISDGQASMMQQVADRYTFRIPRFYLTHVLTNDPADPLWELALPGAAELGDPGTERWDAFQLPEKAVEHPRWVQKYRYEALLRITDYCSGLCRYCYLKNRDVTPGCISHHEIDDMFTQAEASPHRHRLRELIFSGGDPLAAPAAVIEHLADRVQRLNKMVQRRITVSIHTREPVWNPDSVIERGHLLPALAKLAPSSYVLHVVHPREVTPELLQAMHALVTNAVERPPLMMCQHPLFKGISDDAAIITEMYDRLDSGPVVMKPYYLIHPFPDGTLPQHRLTLLESQQILRKLASAPGTRVPLLTVPTPMGKCVIGPWEELVDRGGHYLLHTKDGVPVKYSTGSVYDPAESRQNIPIMPSISRGSAG